VNGSSICRSWLIELLPGNPHRSDNLAANVKGKATDYHRAARGWHTLGGLPLDVRIPKFMGGHGVPAAGYALCLAIFALDRCSTIRSETTRWQPLSTMAMLVSTSSSGVHDGGIGCRARQLTCNIL
jgi:hypothetical protein